MKELKKYYNLTAELYIKAFEEKHELQFEFWVADDIGTIANFNDYYIDYEVIRHDIDNNIKKGKFLEWYDLVVGKEFTINYTSFLKGARY